MKKTILALTVASAIAAPAMAFDEQERYNTEDIQSYIDSIGANVGADTVAGYKHVTDNEGNRLASFKKLENGQWEVFDSNSKTRIIDVDSDGQIIKVDGKDAGYKPTGESAIEVAYKNKAEIDVTKREIGQVREDVGAAFGNAKGEFDTAVANGEQAYKTVNGKIDTVQNNLDRETTSIRSELAENAKWDTKRFNSLDKNINSNANLIAENQEAIERGEKKIYSDAEYYAGKAGEKVEKAFEDVNRKIDSLESDGVEYVQTKADEAVKKSADKLYEAGGREVAKLESAITAVDKGVRMDGEKAYNSLAAAGAREVAKSEAALEAVNKSIRMDTGKAFEGARKDAVAAESAIKAEFANVRKDIADATIEGGKVAIDGVKNDIRKEATAEYNKVAASVDKDVQAASTAYNQDKTAVEGQIASLQAQIDDLRNNNNNNGNGSSEASERNSAKIDDVHNRIDHEIANIGEAGKAAMDELYREGKKYVDDRMGKQDKKIAGLEQDMKRMGNKMKGLEERVDGVAATSHAIINARPVLNAVGEYGVGVGIGAAGKKQAIAVGGAVQVTENWSASTTVNYETKGKYSNHQFSAGVGAQYKF